MEGVVLLILLLMLAGGWTVAELIGLLAVITAIGLVMLVIFGGG